MLSQSGPPVAEPHLNSSLGEFGSLGELFSGVNVRVLRSFESLFQLVELVSRESRPGPSLFPFQRDPWLAVAVRGVFVV